MGISYTHAQTMKKLIHTQDFEKRLAKEAQTMQSIESDFTQVKYLDILDEKVASKGKFYYQKSGKIRMEYAQPVNYLIVINDSRLKIVSDGKKSVMSLTANKMMNQIEYAYIQLHTGPTPPDNIEKYRNYNAENTVRKRKLATNKRRQLCKLLVNKQNALYSFIKNIIFLNELQTSSL